MDDLIEEVNRALRARGWSARRASRQIGGSPGFIRNLRRGYAPSQGQRSPKLKVIASNGRIGPST